MKKTRLPSYLSLLLALVMVLGMAGCGGKTEPVESSGDDFVVDTENLVFLNPLLPPDGSELRDNAPNLIPKIMEMDAINSDTVGWLQVPNTSIDDVVVQSPTDTNNSNAFYLRRGFDKKYLFDGTYFVDYRAKVTEGRSALSTNTVIYGHSMTDDADGKLMDQLKKFRSDEEFARANPYIFFSLEEDELVWEIFAVFDCTVNLNYNNPNPTTEEFAEVLQEATTRSYYDYDVQVSAGDHILTLSTCTYNYTTVYPNDYRFVIMARLVDADEKLREEAVFTVNESRKAP